MSFLSATGFCCAYPEWTMRGIGVLSPAVLNRKQKTRPWVRDLIAKYEARGFRFMETSYCTDEGCNLMSATCVGRRRGFEDSACYTLHFDTQKVPYSIGKAVVVHPTHKTGWTLGGRHTASAARRRRNMSHSFNAVTGVLESGSSWSRRCMVVL